MQPDTLVSRCRHMWDKIDRKHRAVCWAMTRFCHGDKHKTETFIATENLGCSEAPQPNLILVRVQWLAVENQIWNCMCGLSCEDLVGCRKVAMHRQA